MESHPIIQASPSVPPTPALAVAAFGRPSAAAGPTVVVPLPQPTVSPATTGGRSNKPLSSGLSLWPGQARPVVGLILAEALDSRWQTYRKQLRHCQEEFSEEGVHELRVATRRLLAQFVLLDCVTAGSPLQKARRTLKRRLAALSDLRDTHVQLLFISQKIAAYPELTLLRAWVRRRERRLVESAADKVRRCKTRKLERWLFAVTKELTANARSCARPTPAGRGGSPCYRQCVWRGGKPASGNRLGMNCERFIRPV